MVDVLQKDNAFLKRRCATFYELYVDIITRMENRDSSLCRMEDELTKLEAQKIEVDNELLVANDRVRTIDDLLEARQPLYQIGVAIRRRFLEHAKTPVFGTSREDLDQSIIDEGNSAAHEGNGTADASLFFADDVDHESISEIFDILYCKTEHFSYGTDYDSLQKHY